jgi:hypothetical protein
VDAAENDIAGGIEELRKRLGEAQGALGQGTDNAGNRMENALERARRLARAAESLQERTRERAQQGQNGRQGQQGQNGQQAQNGQQQGQGQQQAQNSQGQQGQGQQGQQGQQGSQGSQGSQGQGGQNAQGGQQGGDGQQAGGGNLAGGLRDGLDRGGYNNGGGYFGGAYGGYYGGNWWLSPEDIRQLRGEVRQWTNDATELRRDLTAERIDPRELDEILRQLRQLDDPRVYQDVSELQRLQQTIAEGLKRFEFGLRRQADASQNPIVLSGSDEVPEEFKKLVQEYYRSLAKTPR